MADKHPYPYTNSQGPLTQIVNQLRRSFPQTVTSDTLRKLGLASNNEGRNLNVLKFLGFLDQEGNRTDVAVKTFTIHEDSTFSEEFGKQVKISYSELFDLYHDEAWNKSQDSLISFFRQTDESTELVGRNQAKTFQVLATIAGHGDMPDVKSTSPKARPPAKKKREGSSKEKNAGNANSQNDHSKTNENNRDIGLTVRIEINLPADGDQETYNLIFKSIRENLLNE